MKKNSFKTLVLLAVACFVLIPKSYAGDDNSTGRGLERFDKDVIECGPITTFVFSDSSTLKVRSLYHNVKSIYNWYSPRKDLETIAYEVKSHGIKNTGVLDFYPLTEDNDFRFHLDKEFLVIQHHYGTHMVSLQNLFSVKPYQYEAGPFYEGRVPCRDEMP